MKKLLISFLLIGVTGVIAFGASSAFFSDEVTVEDNTFAAGTIELDVYGPNEANETYTFSNIKPGDSGGPQFEGHSPWTKDRPQWKVINVGSLPGTLTVTFNVRDYDNQGKLIPTADSSLSWAMLFVMEVKGVGIEKGYLGDWRTYTHDLRPGEGIHIDYSWMLEREPSQGWNVLQGHSTEFDVEFYLEQQNVVTVE